MMGRVDGKLAELAERDLPTWYDDAKFGIFVHWGAFSVPGYAPPTGSIGEVFASDYDRAIAMSPYAEWYANAIKVEGTPSHDFHQQHYGGAPYRDFKTAFEEGLKQWDPAAWAEAFRDAGARYVVFVTKHHDGLCLWPSAHENRHEPAWTTKRDVVGEMAAAVRAAGMRFGVYYSGGVDWTFNRKPIRTMGEFLASTPRGDYPAYALAQARELIARYEPSVLWNDIAWPTRLEPLLDLFADYYGAVPDGVVNDRWPERNYKTNLLRLPPVRRYLDKKLKQAFARRTGEDAKGLVPPPVPHSDFRTPEYSVLADIQAKKWESTRGLSHSFGYRRDDQDGDYASVEELIHGFIDAVARNGNLLLNVGPRGVDAAIPEEQLARLRQFGAWMRAHGGAIYGTRPWQRSDGVTECGKAVRFTASPGHLHMLFKGAVTETRLVVKNLSVAGEAVRLADQSPVELVQKGEDLALHFAGASDDPIATAVSVGLAQL